MNKKQKALSIINTKVFSVDFKALIISLVNKKRDINGNSIFYYKFNILVEEDLKLRNFDYTNHFAILLGNRFNKKSNTLSTQESFPRIKLILMTDHDFNIHSKVVFLE